MTVDQRRSRLGPDRVEQALQHLAGVATMRPFERTAGDEIQAVLDDPAVVVDTALHLVRSRHWSVGIGSGPVELPLPSHSRAGRGEAFILARSAVTRAKHSVDRVAVDGADTETAEQADAVLTLLAALVNRRSDEGWQAIDGLRAGATQNEVAERLGVTKQAISARLRVALWPHEQRTRAVAAALLQAADR